MPRNKRDRFRVGAYLRRVNYLAEELQEWSITYEERSKAQQSTWVAQQLMYRARLCDRVLHELIRVDKLLQEVVMTPLSVRSAADPLELRVVGRDQPPLANTASTQ